MHKSRLGTVIVDCKTDNLAREANFWSAALGSTPGKSDERYIFLNGKEDEVKVVLQKFDHPSRVHIDIKADDIEAEVKRLEMLGASIVKRLERWVVMEAPSKHRFSVIGQTRPDFAEKANIWGVTIADTESN